MLGTTIFFAGSCGMMILFRRWRQQGDRLAKILCVTAFGLWCLVTAVGTVTNDQAQGVENAIAGASLSIGFVGAIVTTVRARAATRQLPNDADRPTGE